MMPDIIDRTHRFAKFLRQAVAAKSKPVLEVTQYPSVLWFADLPTGLDELRSPLTSTSWVGEDASWLVVKRVVEPTRPDIPEPCGRWLDNTSLDDPDQPPVLQEVKVVEDGSGDSVEALVPDTVRHLFETYLAHQWTPWAEKTRVARMVIPVYRKLFAIFQEMKGKEDAFDLFVGSGLYDFRRDPEPRVRRHMLAWPAEIRLEEKSGTITLGPSPDAFAARVELEFLPVGREALERVAEDKRAVLQGLWPAISNRDELPDVLRALTHNIAEAAFSDSLSASSPPPGGVVVSLAPALVMRNRSTRSLDELLARIEKDATPDVPAIGASDLPLAWRRMMEDDQSWEAPGGTTRSHVPVSNGRVLFPLPSNEEQSKIVRYANGTAGVVVQGPPGTGKSHTIVNLISHYLATGKRVLVTAQSAQALHVLRDKMPGELQDLCVSLLGDSRRSDKDLERSVNGILRRRQVLDQVDYAADVSKAEYELARTETELLRVERALLDARAGETVELEPVAGYRGTKAAIATTIASERASLGWIVDRVDHRTSCPAFAGGFVALADYHERLDEAFKVRLTKALPDLPFAPSEARDLLGHLAAAKQELQEHQRSGPESSDVAQPPAEAQDPQLSALIEWLTALESLEARLSRSDRDWYAVLRSELLEGDRVKWKTLSVESDEAITSLDDDVVATAVRVEVHGRERAEALRDLTRLSAHYAAGGSRRILFVFKPRVIKETEWVETAVRSADVPPRSPEEVETARRAIDAWTRIETAWGVWTPWLQGGEGSARQQIASLRARQSLLEALLLHASFAKALDGGLCRWAGTALASAAETRHVLSAARKRVAELRLHQWRTRRDELVAALGEAIGSRDVAPAVLEVAQALLTEDSPRLVGGLQAIEAETVCRAQYGQYASFMQAVGQCAPELRLAIADVEGTPGWRARLIAFEAAWNHRRAQSWIEMVTTTDHGEALARQVVELRDQVQARVRELAVAMSWQQALERIDDRRRASLVAWVKAVGNIPATGPSVFRRRAVARSYLSSCLEVIPAWVVSLGRLYETVTPQPGLFDIAIVDEASQCWLDSLALFYLAKQVVVVGDDKQISPTVVGLADGKIAELTDAFISDLTLRGSFTVESSLFDHAQKYLSAGVPLREHFRCVPEIIQFSNQLCYADNPLIPLRQVTRDRLEPLKATFVGDGLRQGDINEREAKALVDALVACHQDPAYEDAEFGVICLQGDAQAARIEQMLLDRLGPGVFATRNLRCGNPYAFQGDERDVVFLSMVAAPNVRNAPLTMRMYQQRFNVALSRGRDQVWLFHSVREDELSPHCHRRLVLEFFRHPPELSIFGVSIDLPTLQLRARRAERRVEQPPQPFDSWFEVDVAVALAVRGYRVSAQVAVGRKRIDLVVEGDEGARLAVECDGDAWHGPEQHEQDIYRQRELERVGWRFSRVRESLFRADETRAIRAVIDDAEELGILLAGPEPVSHAGAASEDPVFESSPEPGDEPEDVDDATDFDLMPEGSDPDIQADATDLPQPPGSGVAEPETEEGAYPDPRLSNPAGVRDAVIHIVSLHGPLTRQGIYQHYRDGCPRVGRAARYVRTAVDNAVRYLERKGQLHVRDEGGRRDASEIVVKLPGQPWFDVRPIGVRRFEDVPLSELCAAAARLDPDWAGLSPAGRGDTLRRVVRDYGIRRIGEHVLDRLKAAHRFCIGVAVWQ